MRTSLFNKFVSLTDDFRKDLDTLWSLPPKQRDALIQPVTELMRAQTKGEYKQVLERAVADMDGDETTLLKSISVLRYLGSQWNPARDTPEGFLDDVKKLSLFPSQKESEAGRFLISFLSALQNDNVRRMREMFANSVAPNFIGAEPVVDFRPVFDAPFGTGLSDRIDDYRPNLISWVPVVLVKINTDEGNAELFFQCQETELRRLIETLQASLIDLEVARKELGQCFRSHEDAGE